MSERSGWPYIHSVGDVLVEAGFVLGERDIPDYEVVYFPEGTRSVYELGDRPIALAEPCIVLTRPGERHRYRFDPASNVRHLFVHFYSEELRTESRFASLLAGDVFPVHHDSLVPGMVKQMLRIAHAQSHHWKTRLSVLMAAILEEMCAESDGTAEHRAALPLPISRAIAHMDEKLAERVTIEEIAQQSGWSHEHFTRVFVSAVGMTPKRALLERRLIRAEQLMMAGGLTVKQIAYRVGFSDEHHFSKTYKMIRGMTATAYIERCRNPLFRHTASVADPETPYPINRYVVVSEYIHTYTGE